MSSKDSGLAINGGKPVSDDFIPIHKPVIDQDDINTITDAIASTFISGDGPMCRLFEERFKEYLGVKHAFFTNSCTGALDLAFMIKEFPKGSEVLVPNFTYTSTALAPILNNLKVKLVDVDPRNGNIDVSRIESSITDRTVAIIPVDYAGNPADMDPINTIAQQHGLYVVHDAAQSLGSKYNGRYTGKLADVSCFSFHGTKNITTGEGGMLVTDDDEIADKVKISRDKGTDKWSYISDPSKRGFYEYVSLGNSYVQSNILGALGVSQMKKIEIITNRRRDIASIYLNELSGIENLALPTITEGATSNWHLFYILVPDDMKTWIIDALKAEGIGSNVHYHPLHLNYFYEKLGKDCDLQNSVSFYNRLVRIPIYPDLSELEISIIIDSVKKVLRAIH